MNGFSSQPGPRDDAAENPLALPVHARRSTTASRVDRQVSGERVFDLNEDGVDHFGLYADWVADLEHRRRRRGSSTTWPRAPRLICRPGSVPSECPGPACLKRRELRSRPAASASSASGSLRSTSCGGPASPRSARSAATATASTGRETAGLRSASPSRAARGPEAALIASDAATHRIGPVRSAIQRQRSPPAPIGSAAASSSNARRHPQFRLRGQRRPDRCGRRRIRRRGQERPGDAQAAPHRRPGLTPVTLLATRQ